MSELFMASRMPRRTGSADSSPLVTVVTPSMNAERWISRCIESVKRQTYDNIEHIVVDGASVDKTMEIIRSHPQLTSISEPDSGQASAINKGLRLAQGEIVTWLNSDDRLMPGAVGKAVDAFRANPSADWLYSQCLMQLKGSRQVSSSPPSLRPESFFENPVAQPGTFFRREALEKVGYLDENLHYSLDFDLWVRLVAAGTESVYLPEILAVFVVHDESKTGTATDQEFVEEAVGSLLKIGWTGQAAAVMSRWLWQMTWNRIINELSQSKYDRAAAAASRLLVWDPISSKSRLGVLMTRISPRLAALAYRAWHRMH